MEENYNIEDTAKLMTRTSGRRRWMRIILLTICAIAVIAVAVTGYRLISDKRYNDQIAIADKYFAEGNYEQAETEYLVAVNMKRRKKEAREGLAYVYAVEGKTAEAIDTYESLYTDTKDEKYKKASQEVSEGLLPSDPELIPAHGDSNVDEVKIFTELDGMTFVFASGVGAWDTTMEIHADGSFEGEYHDSDMGDTGAGYSGGTLHYCKFNGIFTDVIQISDSEYRFKAASVNTEESIGTEYIKDNTKYIIEEPYGIAEDDIFALYLPQSKTSELPEEFIEWISIRGIDSDEYTPELNFYGLYNLPNKQGFIGYK